MATTKRIAKLEVIAPGSNPDIDSDFNTTVRKPAIDHVKDLYGEDKVAKIITFGTAAAKGAFKNMCTIYDIPFAQANKVSETIPSDRTCTITDLLTPGSPFYEVGADFRAATAGEEWRDLIQGAQKLAGRVRTTGQHPCGVIISGKQLFNTIPLGLSKDSVKEPLTQWTYPECENMGLIKFDFLGLDTIDLIQLTVEYILKTHDGEAPSMVELIQGPMDDKKTFEVFSSGRTSGIFQFHTPLATDYCKRLRPTRFEDLAASTALCRPGPMSIQSHLRYAARKNGEEKIEPIHPEFAGSALDEILGETYGLIVYQEQIQIIANRIAGMSLQKADKIRKAAGKKQRDLMNSLGDDFKAGGIKNGYSQAAVDELWHAIEGFAEYGFNKSHSVAYAINAYQCAWLKANYPLEFMAALIAQAVNNKDKVKSFIQEATSMGLKIGPVDVNASDIRVSPSFSEESPFDIVFGLSAPLAVSEENATIIKDERDAHGLYTSVQDVINRCVPLGISNKTIYVNLAKAGAFDCFNVPRRAVIENIEAMMGAAKTKHQKGVTLFDMFEAPGDPTVSMGPDISQEEEFSYVEKLQHEATVLGLYVSDNPLSRIGSGLSAGGVTTIANLMKATSPTTATIVAAVTEVEIKSKKGKTVTLTLDDNTGVISGGLQREAVRGLTKYDFQRTIEKLYRNYETEVAEEISTLACDPTVETLNPIELHAVYLVDLTFRPGFKENSPSCRVNGLRPLNLSKEGMLPIRVRKQLRDPKQLQEGKTAMRKVAASLSKRFPGKYPIYAAVFLNEDRKVPVSDAPYYEGLVEAIRSTSKDARKASVEEESQEATTLMGSRGKKAPAAAKTALRVRDLPEDRPQEFRTLSEEELAERLVYFDTGYTADKTSELEELLSSKLGGERVDFGIFNQSMLEE